MTVWNSEVMYVAWTKSIWPNFFSFNQEGAWGQVWGVCDLGPLCTCLDFFLLLRLLSCRQLAKTCVCCACHIDDDQESWAAHLHQVLPETWALMLRNLQYDLEGFRDWGNEPSRMQVKEWFRQFKAGWVSVESDSEQDESDIDSFLWSRRHRSPLVCTRWSNC